MPVPKPSVITPENEPFRVLLYGDPGAGKTSLAATANLHPDMKPALIVNFDNGLASVTHHRDLNKLTITSNTEMMAVLGEFLKVGQGEYKGIKTLIVDSLSAWRDRSLIEAVDQNSAREAAKGAPRGLKIPQIQDYGQMTYQLITMMHGILQLPLHFIGTAGVDEVRSQDGLTLIKATPLLNPKLLQTINYMMSYIWFARKSGEEKYRLLTIPRGVYTAKTRNPKFVAELKRATRAQSPDKADEAEGWLDIKMDDNWYPTPNIADLYTWYLNSQKE